MSSTHPYDTARMTRRGHKAGRLACTTLVLPVLAVACMAGPAQAAYTHYATATSYGSPASTSDDVNYGGSAASASTSYAGPTWFNGAAGLTQINVATQGQAHADLATGSLKASSSVQVGSTLSGGLASGERQISNVSETYFGETFTITAADASYLTPGATARLSIKIDGQFSATGDIDFNATIDQWGQLQPLNYYTANSSLRAYQVGAFDLKEQASQLQYDDFADYADHGYASQSEYYLAAFNAINNQLSALELGHEWVGVHSNATLVADTLQAGLGYIELELLLDIPLEDLTTAFEWEARLFTITQLDLALENVSLTADFSNTAVISLTLPEGFTLSSESDVFPLANVTTQSPTTTSAVPEPATATLGLLAGGAVMAAMRRRRD